MGASHCFENRSRSHFDGQPVAITVVGTGGEFCNRYMYSSRGNAMKRSNALSQPVSINGFAAVRCRSKAGMRGKSRGTKWAKKVGSRNSDSKSRASVSRTEVKRDVGKRSSRLKRKERWYEEQARHGKCLHGQKHQVAAEHWFGQMDV